MILLAAYRLSQTTDASTSIERQREIAQRYVDLGGHRLVGEAIDSDVSGASDPFRRPGLGPWLRGEREGFDGLLVWRIDRLARSTLHFASLLRWAQDNGKTIISATEGFDLGTPMGRAMATIIAVLAEAELEAIRDRNRGARAYLTKVGRHWGGKVPVGYMAEQQPDKTWKLVHDPVIGPVIQEAARRVSAGETVSAVVADLNGRGVPTALDEQARRAGRESKGRRWTVATLTRTLMSDLTRGYQVPEVRGDDGMRVRRAEPLVSDAEWAALQEALAPRRAADQPRRNSAYLRGVLFCACSERANKVTAKGGAYYRCPSRSKYGTHCGKSATVRAAEVEALVDAAVLRDFGPLPLLRRVFVPGVDHRDEIEAIRSAMDNLTAQLGRLTGRAAETVADRLNEHGETLAALEAVPVVEADWEDEPTGESFAAYWGRADAAARNHMMASSGVRATLGPGTAVEVVTAPAWILERMDGISVET
jgi:site-specific DNA recombinase